MTYSAAITQFAEHARQFVAWCQTDHGGKAQKPFKLEALQHLAAIYNSALYLPQVEFKPAPEAPATTDIQRQIVAQNLLALPFQYYWDLCEPAVPDGDLAALGVTTT